MDINSFIIPISSGLVIFFVKSLLNKFSKMEDDLKQNLIIKIEIDHLKEKIAILNRNQSTIFKKIDELNDDC